MKTVGISAVGGVGRAIADIIVKGYSSVDLYELDVSRFLGLHNNRRFLMDRVREVPGKIKTLMTFPIRLSKLFSSIHLGMHYGLPYPFHEFSTGRSLRMSPIFPALQAQGAVFCQTMGYERPNYFDKQALNDPENFSFRISDTKTFGKPNWFDFVSVEYDACRDKVCHKSDALFLSLHFISYLYKFV